MTSFLRWALPVRRGAALLVACAAMVASLLAQPPAAYAQPDPGSDVPTLPPECNNYENAPNPPGPCYINGYRPGRPTLMLWGDSHAWQWVPALQAAATGRDVNLVGFWSGSCPPMLRTSPAEADCQETNYLATRFVKRLDNQHRKVRVVLGASWQRYRAILRGLRYYKYGNYQYAEQMAGLFETDGPALFRLLGRRGIATDVIGQAPVVPPGSCSRKKFACRYQRSQSLLQESGTEAWVRDLMAPLPSGKRLIDVADQVCLARTCPGYRDGVYTFLDRSHVTATRSRMSRQPFLATFRRLL